jgi:hypothetical protein
MMGRLPMVEAVQDLRMALKASRKPFRLRGLAGAPSESTVDGLGNG